MNGIRLIQYNRDLINKHKEECPLLYHWYKKYKQENGKLRKALVFLSNEAYAEYISLVDKYCTFKRYPKPYTNVSVTTVNGGTGMGYCNEDREWFYNNVYGEQIKEDALVLFWRYDPRYSKTKVVQGKIRCAV